MPQARVTQASVLAISALCLWGVVEGIDGASVEEPIRIRVADHPRPVAAAVLQIEKYFGRPVTYEDTRYVHPRDIVDITAQVRRDGQMAKRVLGMRRGSIDVTYAPGPGTTETQVEEVLQQVLAHSRTVGNTGQFRVESAPGGHHVVPVAFKGKSGVMESYQAMLDTRITLPYRVEDGLELMVRLAHAVTVASGHTLNPGTMPMNRLAQARVVVEAHNDRARDVLWRALQSISPDLSWQLLCDVGENGMCAINIHLVPKA